MDWRPSPVHARCLRSRVCSASATVCAAINPAAELPLPRYEIRQAERLLTEEAVQRVVEAPGTSRDRILLASFGDLVFPSRTGQTLDRGRVRVILRQAAQK